MSSHQGRWVSGISLQAHFGLTLQASSDRGLVATSSGLERPTQVPRRGDRFFFFLVVDPRVRAVCSKAEALSFALVHLFLAHHPHHPLLVVDIDLFNSSQWNRSCKNSIERSICEDKPLSTKAEWQWGTFRPSLMPYVGTSQKIDCYQDLALSNPI